MPGYGGTESSRSQCDDSPTSSRSFQRHEGRPDHPLPPIAGSAYRCRCERSESIAFCPIIVLPGLRVDRRRETDGSPEPAAAGFPENSASRRRRARLMRSGIRVTSSLEYIRTMAAWPEAAMGIVAVLSAACRAPAYDQERLSAPGAFWSGILPSWRRRRLARPRSCSSAGRSSLVWGRPQRPRTRSRPSHRLITTPAPRCSLPRWRRPTMSLRRFGAGFGGKNPMAVGAVGSPLPGMDTARNYRSWMTNPVWTTPSCHACPLGEGLHLA
jgi:hypothetical protein